MTGKKRGQLAAMLMAIVVLVTAVLAFAPTSAQAATQYYIKVNKATNVVTIYNSSTDEPVKAMICSCGGSNTPSGTFYTPAKFRWHELMGPSYGQYCTRITSGVLFHSVWYYENGNKASQSTVQFNRLGTTASHGCVRLTVADAKWIYDNCALGTKVKVFSGTSKDDPLGKPSMVKVSTSSRMGWDPTDPDPKNPYAKYKPSIDVSKVNKVIAYGSTWKPLKNVTAKDTTGGKIAKKNISYEGTVNTNKLGTYKVTYTATDSIGRVATKTVKFKVKDKSKPTITGVQSEVNEEYNSTYKLLKGVKAKSVAGVSLTSKIVVYVKAPGDDDYSKYTNTTIKLSELGKYFVKYSCTNPANKKTKTAKTKIIVKDTKAPVITVPAKTATAVVGETANLTKGVKAVKRSGTSLTKKLILTITNTETGEAFELSYAEAKKYAFEAAGVYKVVYSATNATSGNTAKKTVTYTVEDPNVEIDDGTTEEGAADGTTDGTTESGDQTNDGGSNSSTSKTS